MTVASPTDTPATADLSPKSGRPVYLDCNATTPMDPRVGEEVMKYLVHEFGNAGSRTHAYGQTAKHRVKRAREEVAAVVGAQPDEVFFTSGATESDNLAILGLAAHGRATGKRHIISSQIEHKAVLEPLEVLSKQGFEVTLLAPTDGGWIDPENVRRALRMDTLLVSIMAVNNETGVIQPLAEIAEILSDHDAFFHVDGAQGFGKLVGPLRERRIDLVSISGHKVYAPKGVGALVARRRRFTRPPLQPLMYGGGQERGLRPGTLPVALIAGLGLASALALAESADRTRRCMGIKNEALSALEPLGIALNGDPERTVPHTLNFSAPGVDSEAAIVALKDVAAVSNGSACTSQSYKPSHVLTAARLPTQQVTGALRLSWSHLTPSVSWGAIAERLASLAKAQD
ncbi:cysteine desulfurase DndA [Mycobacterium gordonae]|nr:cysteine desulfurase DndA [Mycobacterium gordonae]OBK56470.1 cysteine desulfurase DndA [Mycobacterium gordonae]